MRNTKNVSEVFAGIDEMTFKVTVEGDQWKSIKSKHYTFVNEKNTKWGDICIHPTRVEVKLNLPRAMGRLTNLYPYKYELKDLTQLNFISKEINGKLKELFGNDFTSKITSVELSYLEAVKSADEVDKFCCLFRDVFAEKKRQVRLYVNKKDEDSFETRITGYESPALKNKFKIKIYDKGAQEGMDKNYLRIEFVLLARYLDQLFKGESEKSIENILELKSLEILQKQFALCHEQYVRPDLIKCLNSVSQKLADKMINSKSCIKAYADMKNEIHCLTQYKRALKKYQEKEGMTDNNRNQLVWQVKKKYGLNDTVVEHLKTFHNYIKI